MDNIPDRTITVSRDSLVLVLGVSRAALDLVAKNGFRTACTEMASRAQVELEGLMADGIREAGYLQ